MAASVKLHTSALAMILTTASLCRAAGPTDDRVVYAPDIVGVERLFMVVLKAPVEAPAIAVTLPDSVALLDQTRLPATSELRKYYFRALKPAKQADLVFAHPAGALTVALEIWSFEDLRQFRTLKGVQLPRRWPLGQALPELKRGQTITPESARPVATGKPGNRQWLDVSDDDIWSLQPDSTIPRWHWVNVSGGCPTHGTEVYRKVAFYPWLDEKDRPLRSYDVASLPYAWKIKCPTGNELYPSNDFAKGDFTGGAFPDDGIGGGYVAKDGRHYGLIAETCQAYCHKMLSVAPHCAEEYLRTGDPAYVHKALVALSRLAVEWAYLGTMTQHRHRNSVAQVERLGPAPFSEGPCLYGSGFTVYCIDLPGYQISQAEAYDHIFPAIDQDTTIIPFLQGKGYAVQTHEEVRRFIEENLFAVWMQGAMDGATHSNEPFTQMGLARMAEVLNYQRGAEFMDWLYDDPHGQMRYFVTNSFFRDGAPYESTNGYNSMHVTAMGPVIESIEHLRQLRPEAYPESKYPNFATSRHYHRVFDFSMNIVNIDRTGPRVGDCGAFPQYSPRPRVTAVDASVAALEHAYRTFRDPKFAWALVNAPGWRPPAGFPFTREQVEAAAAQWPNDWNDASCLQDGYGLAMLRSGKGDSKRALWMMYGRAKGHVHDDLLHLGLDAFQSEILGHMGYPRNWGAWEGNWMTQNQARQIPFVQMTATAQLFADAGPAHVAEAYAQAFSDQVGAGKGYVVDAGNWQRRQLAIIDVGPDQFYALDLYRIFGGKEHWWTFHAQEGEVVTSGLERRRQPTGTLAGPDVPYGDSKWLEANGSRKGVYGYSGPLFAFPHLYNVERATPSGPWNADWALKNADGLHFRLTVAQAPGAEVVLCDGKSPAGASPYEMKWVLQHKTGDAPVATQVVSLMELYRGEPLIKSVRPLALTGADEAGFAACGLVVDLGSRVDTLFIAADPTVRRTAPGGFEFAGRFGLYSERDGKPLHVVLIGGTVLRKDGIGITAAAAEQRARITAVDRPAGTVLISPAAPAPQTLVGRQLFIANPVRRVATRVLAASTTPEGTVLTLESEPLIGTGKVTGAQADRVLTATPFALRGHRYYHGARLVNAAQTAEYQLAGIASAGFALIDTQVHAGLSAERLAAEFPEGSWFGVYDYGVGDQVSWPNVFQVERP